MNVQHVGRGYLRFPVYMPNTPMRWPLYQARWWAMPVIWTVWLWRGLRMRVGWPKRGRAVTVADMIAFHRGKPEKCLCRGEGILTSWRGEERGVSFCEAMLGAFRAKAGFRIVDTKRGPHWVAGFEPERMVRQTVERGA